MRRRVIMSLKKFTNAQNVKCLMACSSMFAHNQMDGKIDFFTINDLMSADQQQDGQQEIPSGQFFES